MGLSSGLMATQLISPDHVWADKAPSSTMRIGIFLFDDVEVLDFAGPFEVFSIPFKQSYEDKIFDVITVSETGKLIKATNGLQVQPEKVNCERSEVATQRAPKAFAFAKNEQLRKWTAKHPCILTFFWIMQRFYF